MTTLVCKDNGTTATSNNTPLAYITSTRTALRQCGALLRKAASNELLRGASRSGARQSLAGDLGDSAQETAEALIAVAKELENAANGS